jgi:glycine/D-amino acid oxidase-like deaminating enzyme
MPSPKADVLVIGDGVIALASALAIARARRHCRMVGRTVRGAATHASGGLLAPSIGVANPAFRELMIASRDQYAEWVAWLGEQTGMTITLNLAGIIDLAADPSAPGVPPGRRLDADQLQALEPAINRTERSLHFQDDGYVDNVELLAALRAATRHESLIDAVEDRALAIEARSDRCTVYTESGRREEAEIVVLAAGAWTSSIAHLPRPIPVEPVRGQMLLLRGCPLSHAVSSEGGYLVPRGDSTLIGSTIERVGFNSETTPAGLETLRRAASTVVPALAMADVEGSWAGLRPMSPDGEPILGVDPDLPSVVYACGHSKNGILLAPITAACIASLVCRTPPPIDISRWGIERFESANPARHA